MIACHKLIRKTAQDFARAQYEELAKDNRFYAQNPSMARFVAVSWGMYVPLARATLIRMLSSSIDETLKRQIYEAIILEKSQPGPQYRGIYVPQD